MLKHKLFLFVYLFFVSKLAFAGGVINFSLSRGFRSEEVLSSSASLSISEKLVRKLFYASRYGYLTGFNNEYDFTRSSLFYTSQGLGLQITDDLNAALAVGVDYDDYRHEDKFRGRASFNLTYRLWE